jgi:hypothetical protein
VLVVTFLIDLIVPRYIDPGSGSIIFQAVAAGAMAVGLTMKVYWRRFTGIFRRSKPEHE